MDVVLEVRALQKSSQGRKVLDYLDFGVSTGEVIGFLGGAHSDTAMLLKILYGLEKADRGQIFVQRRDLSKHLQDLRFAMGYVPSHFCEEGEISFLEYLSAFARYFGYDRRQSKERSLAMSRQLRCEHLVENLVSELSADDLKRLALGRALIHQPEILLLDDILTGASVGFRAWLGDLLMELKGRGTTILLASQSSDFLQKHCDRAMILNQGKVLADGPPSGLISQWVGHQVFEFDTPDADAPYYISRLDESYEYRIIRNRIHIYLKEPQDFQPLLTVIAPDHLMIRDPSLTDLFVKLTEPTLNEERMAL